MDASQNLVVAIMAGGSGTRFWPMSREERPKQFLNLTGSRTMLQLTRDRLEGLVPAERILVLTNARFAGLAREQLPDLPPENVIGEPMPRDTSGAVALAAATAARDAARDLEAYFAEDVPEPFFVKNLERVQGDERDAIIISVGYGKHPDGRMRYQWGPLLRDGGERRLNVAATRARRRLTVVSSFSSHDVDPSRLTAPGARMLAEYLEYARAGGVPVAPVPASSAGYAGGDGQSGEDGAGAAAGAFQSDVAARLAALGITVVPQYGVGGYRVDFAAAHPDDPARMILAIEADGAGYRDSGSVRDRDRLRKEHLERLGWHVHRLWSTAWFTDPGGELAKLRAAFDTAVRAAPPVPPPAPAPWPAGAPEPGAPPEPGAEGPDPERPGDEVPWAAGPSRPGPSSPDQSSGPAAAEPPGPEPSRLADEYWPLPRDAVQAVRAIPLGPGERPRLSAQAPKALPVSAGAVSGNTGPAALPPASEQDGPDPAG